MNDDVKLFFEKYNISNADTIIVACSGGSDSMFLCNKIGEIFAAKNIVIAHFNHRLR